jgi:cytochrome c-type biogenesis protein CcmH
MTGFIVAAAVAVAIVLVLLLRPYFRQLEAGQTSRAQMNAAIYRDQFAKLDQDLTDGTLAREDYEQAKKELQRRVLEDSQAADETATVRAPRKTMIGVAIAVPIVAGAMYLMLGNPAAMSGVGPDGLPAGHEQIATQADLEKMIAALAAKLENEPTNYKGWSMLARSYKALGRPVEAQRAFEKAGSFIDDDAQALASYADVVATNNGGSLAGKPTELINKALKVDPANPMALWLAGTAQFEAKNYKQASDTWEKLAAMLPPGSDDSRMLEGAINDARAKGGLPPRASTAVAASSGSVVKGVVELDPAIKDKASPQDIVMVIARKPGMRMPLAVLRQSAASMPMPFTLDDSLSMDPNSKLSSSPEIEIEARISKTGLAMPNAGDLLSAPQTVKLGANNVTLRVAKVIQ